MKTLQRKRGEMHPPVSSTPTGGHSRGTVFCVCVVLAVAVLAVFGQTLRYGFVNYDDDEYVYENPVVSGGLSLKGIAWAFTHVHSSNWHPITWMSHMLDCQLYGLEPGGHHLTSVLLHAATAILLFLALLQLTSTTGRPVRQSLGDGGSPRERLPERRSLGVEGWCSAFVAMLFAIHPLRVESVAWVAERKDVLSGLFFMLALLAYARYARKLEVGKVKKCEGPVASVLRPLTSGAYWLVVLFFALGLMSKPMLVTLPFVLLLLDYWPLGRTEKFPSPPRHTRGLEPAETAKSYLLVLEKLPLFLMSAASCVATALAQRAATVEIAQLPPLLRVGNALAAYVAYVEQMLWPAGLVVLYPHPEDRLSLWWAVLSLVLLGAASAGAFALRRSRPYIATGWLWYLGMLVPVIGLMQVGVQAHADRYTYLPQIGLYILLAWGAADLTASWRHRRAACAAAAALVVASLMACAWVQTSHWRDSMTLWTRSLAFTSRNPVAHYNLAVALASSAEAIGHYRRALEIKPDYAEAHNNLANALASEGKSAEAIGHYRRALEIKPNYAEAHSNLGNALTSQGKLDEAIEHCRRALEIKPNYAEAYSNLGNALASVGKSAEAIGHYRRALEIKPDYAEAHNNLGNALASVGKSAEAIGHYRRALEIKPDYAEAHNNLGNALTSQGKLDEAIGHCRHALDMRPDYAEAHYNLANALASQGKFAEAIGHYRRALEIKPDYAEAHNNLAMVMVSQDKHTEVIEYLQRSLDATPGDSWALQNLAWLLATCSDAALRNGPEALELARRADSLSGGTDPAVLDILAAAYAEAGQFPEAVETARRALDLSMTQNNATLDGEIRMHLQLYELGFPYHAEAQIR